jgi:diaminohydroxyphosphoribosylaminopyrimidine deaminase/5-amino-6-(5-phosphoribosylamino)uracil reductase
MFDCALVDKVVVFIAPIVIGGEKAKTAVAAGVDKVIDSYKLKRIQVKRFGQDIMISGYVAAGGKE